MYTINVIKHARGCAYVCMCVYTYIYIYIQGRLKGGGGGKPGNCPGPHILGGP